MPFARHTLLLDADDTLWENNIYFERAIARFMRLISPDPARWPGVRERINHEERRVIVEIGYGLSTFHLALTRAFQAVAPERWNLEAEAAVAALADEIAGEPIAFLPGAEETVRYLAPRHRLVLMTKGDYAEQTRKLELSGLAPLFDQVHVAAEKNVEAYRQRLRELQPAPGQCWMIGNSPRSDINPALAAGMNAVLIPHPHTWVLEQAEVVPCPGCEYLQVESIADLRRHF